MRRSLRQRLANSGLKRLSASLPRTLGIYGYQAGETVGSAWVNAGTLALTNSGTPDTYSDHIRYADNEYSVLNLNPNADFKVRMKFRRHSGNTNYEGVFSRDNVAGGNSAGSLWTHGGRFKTSIGYWHDIGPVSYATWYWIDITHNYGTSITFDVYVDGGDGPGSRLYTRTQSNHTEASSSSCRIMAGWNSYFGLGDLAVLQVNAGGLDTNWTDAFYTEAYIPIAPALTSGMYSLWDGFVANSDAA